MDCRIHRGEGPRAAAIAQAAAATSSSCRRQAGTNSVSPPPGSVMSRTTCSAPRAPRRGTRCAACSSAPWAPSRLRQTRRGRHPRRGRHGDTFTAGGTGNAASQYLTTGHINPAQTATAAFTTGILGTAGDQLINRIGTRAAIAASGGSGANLPERLMRVCRCRGCSSGRACTGAPVPGW